MATMFKTIENADVEFLNRLRAGKRVFRLYVSPNGDHELIEFDSSNIVFSVAPLTEEEARKVKESMSASWTLAAKFSPPDMMYSPSRLIDWFMTHSGWKMVSETPWMDRG
jgi:hypothetical protein